MALKPEASWKQLRLRRRSRFEAELDGVPLEVADFGDDAEEFLNAALTQSVERAGPRASFRILIDASAAGWAWEAATSMGTGVTLSPRIRVVRESSRIFQDTSAARTELSVLIVAADPGVAHQGELAFLEREVQAVESALQAGECRSIQTSVIRYATPSALRRILSQSRVDVFHFVGHGEAGATGPALLLEGANPGESARVFADDLAEWLQGAGVRLAVFGGCSTQELAAVAADAGVTATIGFSGRINDAAAMSFARSLYASLAQRHPLEDALLEGRLSIQGIEESWRKPILYLASETPRTWRLFAPPAMEEAPAKRHNLTYDARPFIGRMAERAELSHRLVDLGERLVTITGMGGMGKTRLSRQLAGELSEVFPDGAWFIECDQLESRQEIVAAAATALELEDKSESGLAEWLAHRTILLVFDCFERVVSQGQLLEDLLLGAPGLSILVTSRIVLGLPREHDYPLSPMTLKSGKGQNAESVALFEEAARHARRDFKMGSRDLPVVRQICQMLEGVPLAIVLAAGRLRHVSLAELARYIEDRPHDILRTTRDPSGRHGSLTKVVGDSFALIDVADRRNLAALGAFGGWFTAQDAEVVLDAGNGLDAIGRLRDNSLIESQLEGDVSRYKLLDSVRDFLALISADPSIADAVEAARDRHLELMLAKSAVADTLIKEWRWQTGTSMILDDLANFRAAIRRAVSTSRDEAVSLFARRLARTLFEAGMWGDFETLATAAMDVAERRGEPDLRAAMLGLLGALAAWQQDHALSEARWKARAAICEEIGDLAGLTDSLTDLASQAYEQGDAAGCRRYLTKGLKLARSESQNELVATFIIVAAQIAADDEDFARVRRLLARTQRYLDRAEDVDPTLYVLQCQLLLFRKLGDPGESAATARRLAKRALEANRSHHLGWTLMQMAQLFEEAGDVPMAATCAQAALKLHSEFAGRHLPKARQLVAKLKRDHGEPAERKFAETQGVPWRRLVNQLNLSTDPGRARPYTT